MAAKPSDWLQDSILESFAPPSGGYGPSPRRRLAARSINHPAMAMEIVPQQTSVGKWIPPHLRTPHTMSVQTATGTHDDVEAKLEQTNARLPQGMDSETQNAVVYRMDRLVRDLLASRKNLEDERRKAADKDAEIAQLKQEVAYLQDKARAGGQKHEAAEAEMWGFEQASVLSSANCEEVNELRQLLAFHKTNGEQVSKKLRDLQTTNKDLEAQLQVAETALQEQMSLLSGLGICAQAGDGNDLH
ncbi:hypothetical protein HDV62DRAFT_353240 [Trichoderma sp. SZMC 28011]